MMVAEKPINFLLVDDLEENLLALEALLQREGLTCLKARSGEEALELLLTHDVALALLDVQMPGMDGFELAEFMRGNERARHIPIIFVTAGAADNQRRFRGYEAGAVDFIQKPIEADILRSKANVFFDLHSSASRSNCSATNWRPPPSPAKGADRHKDSFLAVLAHELRNPVAALSGGLHLLGKDIPPERAQDIRARMDRMLAHLTHLVDDLLDVSRVSQGKISLKKERIALSEVLQSAIEASQHSLDAGRHRFITEIPTMRSGSTPITRAWPRSWPTCSTTPPNIRPRAGRCPCRLTPRRHGRDQGLQTRGSASRPKCSRGSSRSSPRSRITSPRRRAASVSGWRWSSSWSRFTAARSTWKAPGRTWAAASASGFPSPSNWRPRTPNRAEVSCLETPPFDAAVQGAVAAMHPALGYHVYLAPNRTAVSW
jgi:CheY-like chemotaxis protein